MEREELRKVQGERLQELVKRVYDAVPFYKMQLQKKGIEPGDIKDIEDLKKLPFTTKQDLRDNYPFGLLLYHNRILFDFMHQAEQPGNRQL